MGDRKNKYPPVLVENYVIKDTVGSGGFAKVKQARHKMTNEKVAIKIMDKEQLRQTNDLGRVALEIQALKELRHQNISRLYQVVETPEKYFLVLEFAPGGELFDYIVARDRCKEEEARVFFRQICAAVSFCHKHGYAHRDLKPENLLLDGNQRIKLIDFGLIGNPGDLKRDFLRTCCGSAAYAAPELIRGEPYLGEPADIWSLGILLYALLCGFLPFDDENTQKLYRLIQRGTYEIPPWLSSGSQQLIASLLKHKPEHRISMDQLLAHPWLTKGLQVEKISDASDVPDLKKKDQQVISELAKFYGVEPQVMSAVVDLWKYDAVTAQYELLCVRKQRGQTIRLPSGRGRLEGIPRTMSRPSGLSPLSSQQFGGSTPNLTGIASRRSPISGSHDRLDTLGNMGSTDTLVSDSCVDVTVTETKVEDPVASARGRSGTISLGECLSPGESTIDKQIRGGSTYDMSRVGREEVVSPRRNSDAAKRRARSAAAAPPAGKLTRDKRGGGSGGLGGSLRSLFGGLLGSNRNLSEPRKVKGLFNVSTTSTKQPSEVYSDILRVLREMKCDIKEKGFIIKAKVPDPEQPGKVKVQLSLEVCLLQRMDLTGIRLSRVKGDSWAYKKVTDDILAKLKL